jgi:hypothetical protein
MLLVIATVKFALNDALGKALQVIRISPTLSANPSTLTTGGTALVTQEAD